MIYRHVIWDWNGTLLDDAWLCLEVINDLLQQAGLPRIGAQRYSRVFGFPLETYCRRLGFDLDPRKYAQLTRDFSQRYEARRDQCRLRRGTLEAVARIEALGITQSILSAYSRELLVEMVAQRGLAGYFRVVAGVDNPYGQGKVALGLEHLAHLGLDPGEVLMVGDTLHDQEVARAMGVDCLLIASGHQHPERLASCGAPVIHHMEEVISRLLPNERKGGRNTAASAGLVPGRGGW